MLNVTILNSRCLAHWDLSLLLEAISGCGGLHPHPHCYLRVGRWALTQVGLAYGGRHVSFARGVTQQWCTAWDGDPPQHSGGAHGGEALEMGALEREHNQLTQDSAWECTRGGHYM